jgi:hypothetical protein
MVEPAQRRCHHGVYPGCITRDQSLAGHDHARAAGRAVRIFPRLPGGRLAIALECTIDPQGFRILAIERLYFRGGLAKVEMAEQIAPHMDPARNSPRGFQIVRDALPEIADA